MKSKAVPFPVILNMCGAQIFFHGFFLVFRIKAADEKTLTLRDVCGQTVSHCGKDEILECGLIEDLFLTPRRAQCTA